MELSIVTPVLNMSAWLKLCIASVEDQTGVNVEHIIRDGGSTDDTLVWLRERTGVANHATSGMLEHVRADGSRYRLMWTSEGDAGMYDAINKGLAQAGGTICAYLNADEQYLPGALQHISDFFEEHRKAEIVCGDVVVIDREGDYCCSRQVLTPSLLHTRACPLGILTAAMFFRRSLLAERDLYFDTSWRNIGDAVWVLRALQLGVRFAVLRGYVSVFTETGHNLNLNDTAVLERQRYRALPPRWPCWFAFLWTCIHRMRRMLNGLYRPTPFVYAIYSHTSPGQRVEHNVAHPTFYWKGRLSLLR